MMLLFLALPMILMGGALYLYSSSGILRAANERVRSQALHLAEAGIDLAVDDLMAAVGADGEFKSVVWDYSDVYDSMIGGATGSVAITPKVSDPRYAWITSTATVRGVPSSVRVYVSTKDVSVWNNAIFAGMGASGEAINGNVDIRGSVHILGDGEDYTDLNSNGQWDGAEPFTDLNGNGVWDAGEPFTDQNSDGAWNPAEPYKDVNSNGIYDAPFTAADLSSDFSGSAHMGNNYSGIPASLLAQLPALGKTNVGGKDLETLLAELRVKHGKVGLSGSASAGDSSDTATGKGHIDGSYVNDGFGGNQGAGHVYSDNGSTHQYDLGDLVEFPYISGPAAQAYTDSSSGVTYDTYADYLRLNSLTVPVSLIKGSTAAFSYGPDSHGNSFSFTPKAGGIPAKISIVGIVRINGDLTIGASKETINYDGRGTLFSEGSVYCHSDLRPKSGVIFPTGAVLGLVALKNIELATGGGDAQLTMCGAFYAQNKIISAKQNQIGGTFVSSFFDMGKNVPSIYQVPKLSSNLPPGMPGGPTVHSVRRLSWRAK